MNHTDKKNKLTRIAYSLMLLDHVVWLFFPERNLLTFTVHFITRLSACLFFIFTAESMYHSKNRKKYLINLFVLTLISHYPFMAFRHQSLIYSFSFLNFQTSIIFNLLLGSLLIYVLDLNIPILFKIISGFFIIYSSKYGDWPYFSVISILIFYYFRDHKLKLFYFFLSFTIILGLPVIINSINDNSVIWWWNFYLYGVLFVAPIVINYDIKEKYSSSKFKKIYYFYYPLHFVILLKIYYLF